MKKVYKILAVSLFALSVAFVGIDGSGVAEAGRVVSQDGTVIDINDDSIYMVKKNHAHAEVTIGGNAPVLVSVRWGKGIAVNQIDSNGNSIGGFNSYIQSAIVDYIRDYFPENTQS